MKKLENKVTRKHSFIVISIPQGVCSITPGGYDVITDTDHELASEEANWIFRMLMKTPHRNVRDKTESPIRGPRGIYHLIGATYTAINRYSKESPRKER